MGLEAHDPGAIGDDVAILVLLPGRWDEVAEADEVADEVAVEEAAEVKVVGFVVGCGGATLMSTTMTTLAERRRTTTKEQQEKPDGELAGVLRTSNHSSHVFVCVDELNVDTGMPTHENPEDLIREALAYLVDVFEVEDHGAKPVDAQKQALCLRP